jgi:hypothetical protein
MAASSSIRHCPRVNAFSAAGVEAAWPDNTSAQVNKADCKQDSGAKVSK